jgi:putative ABC transport system substrate-binding protein
MIRRRDFITFLGGAATAWPLAAQAQTMPIIGYLGTSSAASTRIDLDGFRQGLADVGFVEGRNVAIEYRWAEGLNDRLAALATELVARRVAVMVVTSNSGVLAAKTATATTPIVFLMGGDPVKFGIAASLNRPGGNLTGIATLADVLIKKRLELLHELVPTPTVIGVLYNPSNPDVEARLRDVQAAAQALGRQIHMLMASTVDEIDTALATVTEMHFGALLVQNDPFFVQQRRQQIIMSAARHGVPTGFEERAAVEAGGLMSYGANRTEVFRRMGLYAGRILRGEKPADLPVTQPTKFELVLNLIVAKALGLKVPATLLASADEVIE